MRRPAVQALRRAQVRERRFHQRGAVRRSVHGLEAEAGVDGVVGRRDRRLDERRALRALPAGLRGLAAVARGPRRAGQRPAVDAGLERRVGRVDRVAARVLEAAARRPTRRGRGSPGRSRPRPRSRRSRRGRLRGIGMDQSCQPPGVAGRSVPDAAGARRVAVVAVVDLGLVVRQERVVRLPVRAVARRRTGQADVVRRVLVLVRERRPVVVADRVDLDEDVVVVGLEVERGPELERAAAGRDRERLQQALVGRVVGARRQEPVALMRVERRRERADPLRRRGRVGEQRELAPGRAPTT